jgi:hypothetical protein
MVAKLGRPVAMLTAVLRLVLALLRVSGFKLELERVPNAAGKRRLLGAVERVRKRRSMRAGASSIVPTQEPPATNHPRSLILDSP